MLLHKPHRNYKWGKTRGNAGEQLKKDALVIIRVYVTDIPGRSVFFHVTGVLVNGIVNEVTFYCF